MTTIHIKICPKIGQQGTTGTLNISGKIVLKVHLTEAGCEVIKMVQDAVQ
jgi:hypothetical protein